jgi:UDP-2-acetamido-2-deoxy-ribo-hexuluronate aminotransferase
LGLNARLDTLQAAILLAKLDCFEGEIARRAAIGKRYTEGLIAAGAASSREADTGLVVPYVPGTELSVYAQFTIQVDDRDGSVAALDRAGVPTAVHYPVALHQQPAFSHYPTRQVLSISERVARRVLSLPMHPYLEESEQDAIIARVAECCR